jgi:transcriptional regulator with XRE-family HTH domain
VDDQLAQVIGARVRAARAANHQTKVVVAGLSGITTDYLYQIERGKKLPTITVLSELTGQVRTDTQLVAADGFTTLAPEEFQIDRQLNTATLDATIELFDFVSNKYFPITVDTAWTGVGDTITVKDHFQIKSKEFKLNAKFSGTFQEASAAGTVSDGTTNFIPEPAIFANMGSVKAGELVIIHE